MEYKGLQVEDGHLNRLVRKVSFSILEIVKRLLLVLGDTTICFYGCLEVIFLFYEAYRY